MIEMTCPICHSEFYTPDAEKIEEIQGLKVHCDDCNTKSQLIGKRLIPFAVVDGKSVSIRFVRSDV